MCYIFLALLFNIYNFTFYNVLTFEHSEVLKKTVNKTRVSEFYKNETDKFNLTNKFNDFIKNKEHINNDVLIKKDLSVQVNETLNAEKTCLNKWKSKKNNCCNSIVSIFETQKICNKRLLFEISNENKEIKNKELIEILNHYDLFCNNTKYMELISNNITTEDIYNCINFNNIKTNTTLELKNSDYKNDFEKDSKYEKERNLQLSGWMNEFRLPVGAGPNLLSQSISTEGSFLLANAGPNCSPLLSLVFVRVCNSICNSHHDSSSGISSIPLFCVRDCRPFSKVACMRGCRKFGCNVDLYTCMELMCE